MIEKFNFIQSQQYTLSIRLSTDGFSFSIYNPLHGQDLLYRYYPINTQHSMAANIKQFLAETEELHHPFKQINILVHTERYTPVPLDIYEDEQTEMIFYQNIPRRNNEIVLCNVLGKSNIVILFALDKLSHLLLSEQLPNARFLTSVSPLTEYFSTKSKSGNSYKLFAHIQPESIDLFAFDKGRLHLVNTYPTKNVEDCCYYLLNAWKQLGYNSEHDELWLSGLKDKRKEVSTYLQKYLRSIFIINPQAELRISDSEADSDIPFDMLSLLSCE